jgi:HNH endonuclease
MQPIEVTLEELKKILRDEQRQQDQSRWLFTQNKGDRTNFEYDNAAKLWWTGDWRGTPQDTEMIAHWIKNERTLFFGWRAGASVFVKRDSKNGYARYKTPMKLKAVYAVADDVGVSYEKLLNPEGTANGPQTYVYWPRLSPPKGALVPKITTVTIDQYARSSAVRSWVLNRAEGSCECCEHDAPFIDQFGVPYLEVHHIRQLANGGSDRVSNAVALCPNCHREIHQGLRKDALRRILFSNVAELISE